MLFVLIPIGLDLFGTLLRILLSKREEIRLVDLGIILLLGPTERLVRIIQRGRIESVLHNGGGHLGSFGGGGGRGLPQPSEGGRGFFMVIGSRWRSRIFVLQFFGPT